MNMIIQIKNRKAKARVQFFQRKSQTINKNIKFKMLIKIKENKCYQI